MFGEISMPGILMMYWTQKYNEDKRNTLDKVVKGTEFVTPYSFFVNRNKISNEKNTTNIKNIYLEG
jgi:hypothetical protein